ncbi:MAG: sugar transferase [Cellulosilyticaceae bacterium]
MLAPIVVFAFNRIFPLQRMIESLTNNPLAKDSDLIIFVDGCRNEADRAAVAEVRDYVNKLYDGFRTITRHISESNQGLSQSVIGGVSSVIQKYGRAIILEDDLICTPNFLAFMNQGLESYETDQRIFSICGYGLKIKKPSEYAHEVYLCSRSSSWGWATWIDRWEEVDWEVTDWDTFCKDKKKKREFNKGGSDMYTMLKAYMKGKNNSWAIRYCYSQFKLKKYAICPFLSKIDNKGFGEQATHCKQSYSRFKIEIDRSNIQNFDFPKNITPYKNIEKKCYKYHSIPIRVYSKIRLLLNI